MSLRRLLDGPVDVYLADLDKCDYREADLTRRELDRASRFRTQALRDRFMAARATLRRLLAERTSVSPAEVELVETEYGKLRLALDQDVHFNVSHSHRLGLYGFTEIGDIGIDIEHIRAVDPMALAQACFSERERHELRALPPERRLMAFFDGWVRKEAVIKADGRGMSMPLDSFSVSLTSEARFVEPPYGTGARAWTLSSLAVGPNIRAAVSVREGRSQGVRS